MSELILEDLDQDGAFLDAIAQTHGPSRAEFLRRAAIGSGALLAALAAPPRAASARIDDTGILNFDLTFEFMQANFYTEAEQTGTVATMSPAEARWARVFGAHERAHVKILQDVLGKSAVAKPFFNFQGVTEDKDRFVKTAVAMEDLTTALLAGQAGRFKSRALVAAIFSLLTVEARHAAWVRHISGFVPVGGAFDEPKTLDAVGRVVESTNFISSFPKTSGKVAPRFTG
jgi:Ferritin-like domain